MKCSAHSLTTEISSPKGGLTCCHVVQPGQSGEGVHHLRHQGLNYHKKYQTYLLQGAPPESCGGKSTDLSAQKHDAASLVVKEEATCCKGRCLSIATREVIKTSDQDTTGVSWGFRQNDRKKNKLQLKVQSV